MPPQLLGMAPDQRVVTHHLNGPEEEREVLGRKGNRALTALAWLSSSIGDLAESEIMTQHEMQEALVRVDEMTRAQFTVQSTTYRSKFLSCKSPRSALTQQKSTALSSAQVPLKARRRSRALPSPCRSSTAAQVITVRQ